MHHPTDRIAYTTAFVTPVVEHWLEREIAQWVHHEELIRQPMSERPYHRATFCSFLIKKIMKSWLALLKPQMKREKHYSLIQLTVLKHLSPFLEYNSTPSNFDDVRQYWGGGGGVLPNERSRTIRLSRFWNFIVHWLLRVIVNSKWIHNTNYLKNNINTFNTLVVVTSNNIKREINDLFFYI